MADETVDGELTSSMGNVLSTLNKDDKNDANDSTPTSSTDANTTASKSQIVTDDPISSTSSDIQEAIKTKEDVEMDKQALVTEVTCNKDPSDTMSGSNSLLVSDADLLCMKITDVSDEKITEDVEDIVQDLENLLGESSSSFPKSPPSEKQVAAGDVLETCKVLQEEQLGSAELVGEVQSDSSKEETCELSQEQQLELAKLSKKVRIESLEAGELKTVTPAEVIDVTKNTQAAKVDELKNVDNEATEVTETLDTSCSQIAVNPQESCLQKINTAKCSQPLLDEVTEQKNEDVCENQQVTQSADDIDSSSTQANQKIISVLTEKSEIQENLKCDETDVKHDVQPSRSDENTAFNVSDNQMETTSGEQVSNEDIPVSSVAVEQIIPPEESGDDTSSVEHPSKDSPEETTEKCEMLISGDVEITRESTETRSGESDIAQVDDDLLASGAEVKAVKKFAYVCGPDGTDNQAADSCSKEPTEVAESNLEVVPVEKMNVDTENNGDTLHNDLSENTENIEDAVDKKLPMDIENSEDILNKHAPILHKDLGTGNNQSDGNKCKDSESVSDESQKLSECDQKMDTSEIIVEDHNTVDFIALPKETDANTDNEPSIEDILAEQPTMQSEEQPALQDNLENFLEDTPIISFTETDTNVGDTNTNEGHHTMKSEPSAYVTTPDLEHTSCDDISNKAEVHLEASVDTMSQEATIKSTESVEHITPIEGVEIVENPMTAESEQNMNKEVICEANDNSDKEQDIDEKSQDVDSNTLHNKALEHSDVVDTNKADSSIDSSPINELDRDFIPCEQNEPTEIGNNVENVVEADVTIVETDVSSSTISGGQKSEVISETCKGESPQQVENLEDVPEQCNYLEKDTQDQNLEKFLDSKTAETNDVEYEPDVEMKEENTESIQNLQVRDSEELTETNKQEPYVIENKRDVEIKEECEIKNVREENVQSVDQTLVNDDTDSPVDIIEQSPLKLSEATNVTNEDEMEEVVKEMSASPIEFIQEESTIADNDDDGDQKQPLIVKIDDNKNEKINSFSPKIIIKPPKSPAKESSAELEEREETKGSLKMTITKQSDTMHSILKVYNPDEETANTSKTDDEISVECQEPSIPKLIIKSVPDQSDHPLSPKMMTRSSKVVPNSTQRSGSPRITIKPIVKPENHPEVVSPLKITISKSKNDDTHRQKHSPKLSTRSAKMESDSGKDYHSPRKSGRSKQSENQEHIHSPRVTIKPIVKPSEDTDQNPNPKITIKPIPKPSELESVSVAPAPRVTIKPLPKPQEDSDVEVIEHVEKTSPKITIKPVVKPNENESQLTDFEDAIKERIVLKINKPRKRDLSEEDRSEKLAKIKLKFSKEGGHPHIVQQPSSVGSHKRLSDSDYDQDKCKRQKTDSGTSSTDSSHSKLKDILINNPKCSKTQYINEETVCSDDVNLNKNVERDSLSLSIKDSSNVVLREDLTDPLSEIPVFEITPEGAKTMSQGNAPQTSSILSLPAAPRKRGRPRKVPLEIREEFKDEIPTQQPETPQESQVQESSRPKRSCRGQSVRATLGIKPRKPRGAGAPRSTRGTRRGRGRGIAKSGRGKLSAGKLKLMRESVSALAEEAKLAALEKEQKDTEVKSNVELKSDSPDIKSSLPGPIGLDTLTTDRAEIVMFEEETRMSADTSSRAQTPAKQIVSMDVEESQSSVQSSATTESAKGKKGPRLEVHPEPEGAVISADQLAEYCWSGAGPFMLQEQVAQFLGIKSFKRKYPNIQRRMVDMQERDFIRESGLASEAMCDLGLTAVNTADILDIMYTDFQDKYEEYCKHQRDRQAKDLINKQKALSIAASQEKNKLDITEQAVHSAAAWNSNFNKTRRDQRRACLDLQTLTVHYPKGRIKEMPKEKVGNYPVALVPGQFTDYYKEFTPTEINNLPLNTMCYEPINRITYEYMECDSQSDDSGSDSDSSSSSSDSSDSDSSDGEDCKICKSSSASKVASV